MPETFGTRCWGSAYGWVAMVDRDLNVQLFNPISKAQIHFPSLDTIPNLPSNFDKNKKGEWFLRCFLTKLFVVEVSHIGHREFVIMVLYKYRTRLAYARHGDESWTSVFIKENSIKNGDVLDMVKIFDVVGIDDNVFAMYNDGSIVYWNVEKFDSLESLEPMDYLPAQHEIFDKLKLRWKKIYLIQLGNDLLMLLRYKEQVVNSDNTDYDYDIIYRTIGFDVYRLDPKDRSWERIDDFGNVALFVGGNASVTVSVEQAKYLQPNCIYFTDDESEQWKLLTKPSGHDMGVFNVVGDEIWQFYKGDDTRSLFCPPFWFIPQL